MLKFPASEIEIFFLAHEFLIFCSFIPIAAEMQNAMDDDPVQLVSVGYTEGRGIIAHPVYADKHIAAQHMVLLCVIKCDDIGERLMIEVLFVDRQQVRVGAEHKINVAGGAAFRFGGRFHPLPDFSFLLGFEVGILVKEVYFSHRYVLMFFS